ARGPSSTLFPYTTLFRSAGTASSSLRSAAGDPQADQELQRPYPDPLRGTHAAGPGRPPVAGGIHPDLPQDHALSPAAGLQGPNGDRKSTRLNSSHVKISY